MPMKLRTKTVIGITVFCLVIVVIVHLSSSFLILPAFKNLEDQECKEGISQVLSTLNYRLSQYEGKVRDYAFWDDTYEYVLGTKEDYIENNFIEDTFENLDLNLVAIVDNNKNLLFCQSYDLELSQKTATSKEMMNILTSDASLWSSINESISGLILAENRPTIIASSPILTSLIEGPSVGNMFFCKTIDDSEIENLKNIMNLDFSLMPVAEFRMEDNNDQTVDSLLSISNSVLIRENNLENVSGLFLVEDVHSDRNFVLQVTKERSAFRQGLWVRDIISLGSVSLTLCFGAGILILLERNIVQPMTELAKHVKEMPIFPDSSSLRKSFRLEEFRILSNAVRESMNKKLEGMNEVSRMVGHDLRNPLTGIKGAVFTLRKNYASKMDDKAADLLNTIDDCVNYSDKIVRDLLEYSCEIKLDKIKVDVRRLVDDSLSTLIVPDNIEVHKHLDEFVVLVDNGKIERVFGNLIKNAFDAMPDGGELEISSRKVRGDIEISFSDSGVGMTKEVLDKLWSPFFTTKAKGMGIGLSICRRIVEAHNGRIEVKSVVGKGSTFSVFLPEAI